MSIPTMPERHSIDLLTDINEKLLKTNQDLIARLNTGGGGGGTSGGMDLINHRLDQSEKRAEAADARMAGSKTSSGYPGDAGWACYEGRNPQLGIDGRRDCAGDRCRSWRRAPAILGQSACRVPVRSECHPGRCRGIPGWPTTAARTAPCRPAGPLITSCRPRCLPQLFSERTLAGPAPRTPRSSPSWPS